MFGFLLVVLGPSAAVGLEKKACVLTVGLLCPYALFRMAFVEVLLFVTFLQA